ncbi:MAG: DNA/RNA nuclease SfsA [Bdellovibrionales bacterium]|nr:DNA/RNA nuclease SfsA [Bdellovibrionales bacterium]
MKFNEPLLEGVFKRRYQRFFAEIEYNGAVITAHLPNTGSLKGCLKENIPCLFLPANDPQRKLPYTLQMVRLCDVWIGVNTSLANALAWEAFQEGRIPPWRKFDSGQKEVKIHSQSRIDMAFWKSNSKMPRTTKFNTSHLQHQKFHFVEIKNVTFAENGLAMFPDAVTVRGQKHLNDLMDLKTQGHSAEVCFVVQRSDCRMFAPADTIDPEYGKLLRKAVKSGVKVSAYSCELNSQSIEMKESPLGLDI